MKNSEFVTQWVLDRVKEQYSEDIALIVSHNTLRIDKDKRCISYFVPVTDKGRMFSQTFILAGEGFDIWGIEWERLEHFADLNEYNITCLADGEVLYARTSEDRTRFEQLKKRQAENLANPTLQRVNALEAFAQAKQIYFEMLFANGSDVKLGAGYVMDYLARAIAFSHGSFFKCAQTEQLAELLDMGEIPDGFSKQYHAIISEQDEAAQKKQCYELIKLVEHFLERPETMEPKEHNFQDLADWYAELSYTWLRIRHYSATGEVIKVYMWGCMLQEELNRVCSDFGLPKPELMAKFQVDNLKEFSKYSDSLEIQMRKAIQENGGIIREFADIKEFLHEV